MLESKIQSKIVKKLTEDGWLVIKLIRTSIAGVPDLMALKEGKTIFIEVKQPKGVLSEIQHYRIAELRSKGFEVYIWTDYQVDYEFKHKDKDEMWF
ncbi:VRR-NUC domain-containing protein [Flavobacterium sp.]|uniref:VRR-NUC domain-containing protein n=1 Tax=Flavobacterium sp. TaxID=239 RepID=UPI0025D2F7B6|nr:VRR-NUC domain-containing protein [Flavobacterium sp.]